ncbi:PaaI family thioesterase [Algimonas porphyrae]
MTQTVPDGFVPHDRPSPFTNSMEPIFARIAADQYALGTQLRAEHCNSRGLVHGGFIATLADNAMGLTCGLALMAGGRTIRNMVTVNLSIDYVGQAQIGDWLQTDSRVVKLGRSLAFVETHLLSGATIVSRASATFKIKTD